jgi:hypothetical protein
VVFSRGYGLEDDEKAVGDHSFTFTVGDDSVIQALNDAIPGMQGNVFFILLVLFVCVCAVCAVMAWRIMVLVAYRQFTHSVIVVLHPSIFLLINDTITNTDPTIHTHKHTKTNTVGALRRISILPQKGWNKNTKQCDGGPGGSGAGGDLKTDYVVVPTATMVEQEACFDKTKRPFPGTYAQERRMAQRFDQSLIMEVRLVNVLSGGDGVVNRTV